ncbi:methyl-accepting chemotaxis protein [Paracraurococcus lichenis]|uniref:Methyl-accepting chemotaxis protein n=1 Tax=Paracraurococcus lichenis TaxID=3064888 RepID=A0ABT9E440_9PROT|nr:methyl-accepting chemotaxis protein [Paracraurococcus sp. LOR1-02]MDO9710934.1 methyl-accepting chemotaxis protein [Paracraurococcus sp. LOR1-02]
MISAADENGLTDMASALRAVAAPLERDFAEVGGRLARSDQLLGKVIARSESLVDELGGTALADATRGLRSVAEQVPQLACALRERQQTIRRLESLVTNVRQHASQMANTIRTIGILAINARISAAGRGVINTEFAVFTNEVFRIFEASRSSLEGFGRDLAGFSSLVLESAASQSARTGPEAGAVDSIPRTLGDDAAAISQRCAAGAVTSQAIRQRSTLVQEKVSSAVMALQIGDTTRQRVEHVAEAMEATQGLLSGPVPPVEVAPAQRGMVLALAGRLEVALLNEAADDFEAESRRVSQALRGLAADAEDICRIGAGALGAAGEDVSLFLGKIEASVGEAAELLQHFQTAYEDSETLAASVAQAVAKLVAQIRTVSVLEAELRLMGLNMVLKSNRLGDAGRVFRVVAQELRACADQTTVSAADIRDGLTEMERAAAALAPSAGAANPGIAEVARTLKHSMASLAATTGAVTSMLTELRLDSEALGEALSEAAERIEGTGIAAVMRQTAARTGVLAAGPMPHGEELEEIRNILTLTLPAKYTMASERETHRRLLGGAAPALPEPEPAGSLEDLLF